MNTKEFKQLIEDLLLAATLNDLAKTNLQQLTEKFESLNSQFNAEVGKMNILEIQEDQDLMDKLVLANKVFDALNIK